MKYKIKKGDVFLCIKDYIMDEGEVAYTKGKTYLSEYDGSITDNDSCVNHEMGSEDDFFEYFTKPGSCNATSVEEIEHNVELLEKELVKDIKEQLINLKTNDNE